MTDRWAAAVALAWSLVGCHGCHQEQASPSSDAPALASVMPSASALPPEAGTLEAVDRRSYAEYTRAIERGRRATLAKNWAGAKAAFDAALRERPRDMRALAERGYAELLAGDGDAARSDLQAARSTDDKALAAQVWFNLGLLDTGADGGATDDATADFWFSNQLHPSEPARARIAGRSVCPVTVDDARVTATHATSWLAVAKVLASSANARCPEPKTEADAKARAETPGLSMGTEGMFYVVRSGTLDFTSCIINVARIVQVRGADFWVYPEVASGTISFMLPTDPSVDLAAFGRRVRATTTESWPQEVVMCTVGDADTDVFECKGDPGEQPAGMAHVPTPPDYTDFVLDPVSHQLILRIQDHASGRFAEFTDGGRAIDLTPIGDAVSVSGLGCGRTIALH